MWKILETIASLSVLNASNHLHGLVFVVDGREQVSVKVGRAVHDGVALGSLQVVRGVQPWTRAQSRRPANFCVNMHAFCNRGLSPSKLKRGVVGRVATHKSLEANVGDTRTKYWIYIG